MVGTFTCCGTRCISQIVHFLFLLLAASFLLSTWFYPDPRFDAAFSCGQTMTELVVVSHCWTASVADFNDRDDADAGNVYRP